MQNNMDKFKMASDIAGGIKMIEGDDKARAEKCLAIINQTLAQFDCIMYGLATIGGPNGIVSMVKIEAKPRVPNNGPGKTIPS